MGDSLTSYARQSSLTTARPDHACWPFSTPAPPAATGPLRSPATTPRSSPTRCDYFYQDRGFCLAEAYYQSLLNPYQGLLVGEPLSAPFARPGTADWSSLTNGTVLSGQAGLNLTFSAAATNLPLGQVDLFLDGSFVQTVTNLLPSAGNVLSVTLNGFTVNYTVPTNATVASVATGLAAALNAQTNSTRVQAYAGGRPPGTAVARRDGSRQQRHPERQRSPRLRGPIDHAADPRPADLPRHHGHRLPRRPRQQHPGRRRLAPARLHQDQRHAR